MMPPTSIDGTDITGATIDGTDVQEITVDGDTVFTAGLEPPSAGLVHYWDWSAQSATTSFVEDEQGSSDLTGSFSGFGTINGIQAGTISGSDIIEGSIPPFSSDKIIAQVFQAPNQPVNQFLWDDDNTPYLHWIGANNFRLFNGDDILKSSVTNQTTPTISLVTIDPTITIRINGTQVASGSGGSNTMDTFRAGQRRSDSNFPSPLNGEIGESLIYDKSSASISDIETYLSDKWGVPI